jgi:hypothetical protein
MNLGLDVRFHIWVRIQIPQVSLTQLSHSTALSYMYIYTSTVPSDDCNRRRLLALFPLAITAMPASSPPRAYPFPSSRDVATWRWRV